MNDAPIFATTFQDRRTRRVTCCLAVLLANSGLLGITPPARAADASPPGATQVAPSSELAIEEVVVTARRKSENLQIVPQTVDAVTSADIHNFSFLKLEDLTALVPGLQLESGSAGYNAAASVRGVTFDEASATTGTVQFYLNDARVDSNEVFQSLYDIGQIEVLRGPQGTLHGESAPSGAITLTTHKPDLEDYGGYASVTGGNDDVFNLQGAVNVPLIDDKLAVRLAGVVDNNNYDGVRSINNGDQPFSHTRSERASVLFQPTSKFTATLVYQHLARKLLDFTQVAGPGAPGLVGVDAPNYNGPPITPQQRLAVANVPNTVAQAFNIVTANMDYTDFGQKIDYVGSYSNLHILALQEQDPGNQYPAEELLGDNLIRAWGMTHELRLSSAEPIDNFFDYTAGFYYAFSGIAPISTSGMPAIFLGASSPFISATELTTSVSGPPTNGKEVAYFADFTFHLPFDTEFTAGTRYYETFSDKSAFNVDVEIGKHSMPVISQSSHLDGHPWIYSASLSHKFADDIMAYVTSGSAWRFGPTTAGVGIQNAENNPTLDSFSNLKPENSWSIESGVKTTFLDDRGLFNIDVYHQVFYNYIYHTPPITYLGDNGVQLTPATFNFTANANAVVNGFEATGSFAIMEGWNVNASYSYADGHTTGSPIPCNPPGGNVSGSAFPPGTYIFLCKNYVPISRAPLWNGTVQSEFTRPLPIGNDVDGFVRGLVSIYGSNNRVSEFYVAPAYALVNFYLGARSEDGAWELYVYAKNLFGTEPTRALDYPDIQAAGIPVTQFGPSGYQVSSTTAMLPPQRQFGVTLTYAFGSR